ncbi:MAG: hypothetical protein RR367_06875, partial [Clostridia bacterium]
CPSTNMAWYVQLYYIICGQKKQVFLLLWRFFIFRKWQSRDQVFCCTHCESPPVLGFERRLKHSLIITQSFFGVKHFLPDIGFSWSQEKTPPPKKRLQNPSIYAILVTAAYPRSHSMRKRGENA